MRKLLVPVFGVAAMVGSLVAASTNGVGQAASADAKSTAGSRQATVRQPGIAFEPNVGQDATDAQFIARSGGYLARLSRRKVSVTFQGAIPGKTGQPGLDLIFRGANEKAGVSGEDKLLGLADYFPTGNPADWKTNIPTFGRVEYRSIYPGVDVSFYGREGRLEYDVDVAAHADPNAVQIELNGRSGARVDAQGDLVLRSGLREGRFDNEAAGREMRFLKPVAYQIGPDGTRQPVEARYRMRRPSGNGKGKEIVSFSVGKYDHSRPLVIDPVLVLAEFVPNGSEGCESIRGIAADASGNVYLTSTCMPAGGWPFIQKLDANGNVLFTVELGTSAEGDQGVYPTGIAVDSSGNISVSGYATAGTIPTTSNAYQQTNTQGGSNAFLAVLNSTGSSLTYVSYLDGTLNPSVANGIAVDSLGKIYLTGYSNASDFPTTTGAYAKAPSGSTKFGFVAKFDPTKSGSSSLVYSTALPASGSPVVEQAIAVDSSGDAYVTGQVTGTGFPITSGAFAYSGTETGQGGVFVTKVNSTGTGLAYSANLGPGYGYGIAVDGSGDAYVTGSATFNDYPTTAGAWQTQYPTAFATELNAAGNALVYSTFLNGPSGYNQYGTYPNTISIPSGCSSSCVATVAGFVAENDLPLVNPIQSYNLSGGAGFLIQLAGNGESASFSTYLGALQGAFSSSPGVSPVATLDGSGNIYFAANNGSTDLPLTVPLPASTYGYGYLAKIGPASASLLQFLPSGVGFGAQVVGVSTLTTYGSLPTTVLTNLGSEPAALETPFTFTDPEFTETDNCPASLPGGGQCTLKLSYTPTISGSPVATLTATANAGATSAQLQVAGSATDGSYLTATPTNIQFGDQTIATASAAQVVTLTNIGNQTFSPGAITIQPISNADSTTFLQVNNCPATMDPQQSCQVSIQFTPSVPALSTAQLYVGYLPNVAELSGTGIASGSSGSGSISLTGSILNFGTQPLGTPSAVETEFIENTGVVPVSITGDSVTLTSAQGSESDFKVTYAGYYTLGACNSMPPGDTNPPVSYPDQCNINITFTPSVIGTETATVSLYDSTAASPHTFTVSGIGVAATQTLESLPGNAVFGNVTIGSSSPAQTFYFFDTGSLPMTIDRVLTTGDFQSEVEVNDSCPGSVIQPQSDSEYVTFAAGTFCLVQVVFSPTASGARTGTLELVDSAAGTTQVFNLMGTGAASAGVGVAVSQVRDFPTQATGTTSEAQSIELRNTGTEPVTINSLTGSGDFATTLSDLRCAWGAVSATPFTIAHGETCTGLGVLFTPTQASGRETGSLTIGSSAGTSTIRLSGTAAAAAHAAGLTSTSISFGEVAKGTTAGGSQEYVAWIRNAGTERLTIAARPVITPGKGTPEGDFSVIAEKAGGCERLWSRGESLAPQESCALAIAFTPHTAALERATLTMTDSAGSHSIALSGTGTAHMPLVHLDPATLNFRSAPVGTAHPGKASVHLHNNADNTLSIVSAIVSAGSSDYVIDSRGDGCSGRTVAAHSSCEVDVTFHPTSAGLRTGTVTFTDQHATAHTVELSGFANPEVSGTDSSYLDPTVTAFLDQVAANPQHGLQPQTFNLINNGTTSLTVGKLSGVDTYIGSSTSGDFVAANVTLFTAAISGADNCSSKTVSAGSSCSVTVYFVPATTGVKTGSITFPVTYKDGTTTSYTANLSGNSIAAYDGALLAPSALTFEAAPVGTTDAGQQIVNIVNNGNVSFNVGKLSGTNFGSGGDDFNIGSSGNGCPSGDFLQPTQFCTINIAFTPQATGARTGSLIIPVTYLGASSAVNLTAPLSGTGIAAAAEISSSVTTLTFPNTAVTASSPQLPVIFSNRGSTSYSVTSDAISGTNAGDFAITSDGCTGTSLSLQSNCTLLINFTPSASGTRTATLTEKDTAPGSPRTVTLVGNGVTSAQIAFLPTSLSFAQQAVGSGSAEQIFGVTNSGVASTNITSVISTVPAEFSVLDDNCSGQSLTPGSTCTVGVVFSPAQTGTRTANINVATSSAGTPSLAASGTGVAALSSTITLKANTASAAAGSLFVLTASVKDSNSNPITVGSVAFYNGGKLLGTSQIIGTTAGGGVVGTAIYRTRFLPIGANSLTAKYIGPDATGVTAGTTVTVTGTYPSTTSLVSTGTQGDYTLTATVEGAGPVNPTGNVVFTDQSTSATLGTVALNTSTATLGFVTGSTPTVGTNPTFVTMADLNGDGIPDLIEILQDANIVVLLGKGDGTFQAAQPLSVGSYGNVLAVGDFNGDGKLDIATTGSASVYILLGHGDGTFGEPKQFQAGNDVAGIVVGDFNGDGHLDIATANAADQTVTILQGNGDGTFLSPAAFGAGNHPVAIAAADFNGDGKLDVAVTNNFDNTVSVLLGNGNGTLQTQKVFSTNPNNSNAQGLAVGDVNGDGKLDILVLNAAGNTNTSTLAALTGAGNGTFTTQTPVTFGPQPVSVAAGDVNGDGKLDVVVTYATASAGVLLGNGNGTFQTEKDFPTGNGSEFAAIGDLNGDGKPDIATANFTDGTATILLNEVNEQAVLDNVAVTGTGTHNVVAAYGGDTNYAGSTSNTVQLSAAPVAPTMTLTAQPSASVSFGTSLSVLVTMTGPGGSPTPTGQVNYTVDGGTQKSATLSSGGTATLSLGGALAVGGHSVSVTYVATATYLTTTKSISLTVTKTAQTISFTPVSNVTYGAASFNLSATASSGLAVTYKVDSGPATISGNTVTITGAGSVVLEADQAGNATYAAASAQQTVTVAKAPLTLTINSTSRSYGAANPAFSGVFTGLVNGDTLTPTYSTTATSTSPVGNYPINATLNGAALPNYTVTVTAGVLTVGKATLTFKINTATRLYGAADPAFSGTFTGLENGDVITPTYSSTDTMTSPVGNYVISATLSGAPLSNYTATVTNGTLSVTAAPVTITVKNATRTYGAANPTLSGTITGALNGDVLTANYSTTATVTSAAGSYPITATLEGAAAGNYKATVVPGTLTVGKAALDIVVKSASKVYGAANPAFTGTVTGLLNGDTVTTTYSTTATQYSAVGGYPITAAISGAAAGNYNPVVTPGTLTVTPAGVTITVNAATRSYGAANPTFTGTITGVLNNDAVSATYSTTATATSPVGTYPITATLTGAAAGNYKATVVAAKLTITKATLTVTANNASKVYGAALPSLSYAISGFLNGDTAASATTGAAVLSTTATSKSKAGSYPIDVAAGTLAATNYSFKLVDGTLTVAKAKLTVTANSLSMVYGAAPPTLTYTMTGFVNGDTAATATTGAPALTTTAKDTSSVGTYTIAIAAGTLEASNYTLTLADGKLTVTTAPLTVVVKSATRAYGAANPTFTGTVTGTKNDDALTVSYSTTATVASVPGSYPITAKVTGTKATNYKIAITDGTLTVAKAVLTVTATNVTVTYGKALPKLTYTVTGFKNGNTISVVSGAPVETTTAKTGSAPGTYPITITAGTLKAANYTFTLKDGTLTIATLGTVATPTFSPVAGTYSAAQTVTIADATKGATIYYALHGAIPTTASTKYTGPIAVPASETVKAIAVLKDYTNSAVASATFTIK